MFDQAQVVSITPSKSGTGGSKTAVPSSLELPDIRDAKNILIKSGSWQNIGGISQWYTGGPHFSGILYPYVYHSATIPVVTSYSLLAFGVDHVGPFRFPFIIDMSNGNSVVWGSLVNESADSASFETVKERCYFSTGADAPRVYDGPAGLTTYYWGIQNGPIISGITIDPAFSDTTVTFEVTNGSSIITWVAGTALDSAWQGKTIWLPSDTATGINDQNGVRYTIANVDTMGGTITLNTAYTGTTFPVVPATPPYASSRINFGNMTWTEGPPTYACSYYDSTRAHSGNVGNFFRPEELVAYNVNLTVNFAGDTTGALARADQIIVWSTTVFAVSGSLYALSVETNANGPVNYYDDRLTDNGLGLDPGPYPAPYQTNDPPKYFKYVAYWNGTMWGLAPQGPGSSNSDVSLLFFSRVDDPGQIGRGEECWPLTQFLRIPAKDGAGLGLAVIGDVLVVTTDRYIYYVAGTGPGDYRLAKISSRGLGVSNQAISEFAGDATSNSSAMIFLGKDRAIWAQAPGGAAINLGLPVQDFVDDVLRGSIAIEAYPKVRVRFITIASDSYAVILLD